MRGRYGEEGVDGAERDDGRGREKYKGGGEGRSGYEGERRRGVEEDVEREGES